MIKPEELESMSEAQRLIFIGKLCNEVDGVLPLAGSRFNYYLEYTSLPYYLKSYISQGNSTAALSVIKGMIDSFENIDMKKVYDLFLESIGEKIK